MTNNHIVFPPMSKAFAARPPAPICLGMVHIVAVMPYLIGLSLAAVLMTLFAGAISMSRGGAFNDRWGNRLMRLRVATQAVAVGLLLLFYLLTHN